MCKFADIELQEDQELLHRQPRQLNVSILFTTAQSLVPSVYKENGYLRRTSVYDEILKVKSLLNFLQMTMKRSQLRMKILQFFQFNILYCCTDQNLRSCQQKYSSVKSAIFKERFVPSLNVHHRTIKCNYKALFSSRFLRKSGDAFPPSFTAKL